MGFVETAGTPGRRTIVQDLKRTVQKPNYTNNPDQIFDNMDSDPQIPDSHHPGATTCRTELIDLLEAANPGTDPERSALVCNFCHKHTQEGARDDTATDAVLGKVHLLQTVANLVLIKRGGTLDQVVKELRKLVRIKNPTRRLRLQRERLAGIELAQYQMWSFYDDQASSEPFTCLGNDRETVVVRLGLGQYDEGGAELIRWTHRLHAGASAFQPSAWDADAIDNSVHWRPGGQTQPLRLGFGPGLPEVVHDAITVQEFEAPAEPLEA